MTAPDLHKFKDDLAKRPALGTLAPPRIVKAQDLDDNFRKTTLLEGAGNPKLYEVRYTKDGTRITRILPDGTSRGDLLYWNGTRWVVFPAASGAGLRVLTIQNNTLAWTPTQDC